MRCSHIAMLWKWRAVKRLDMYFAYRQHKGRSICTLFPSLATYRAELCGLAGLRVRIGEFDKKGIAPTKRVRRNLPCHVSYLSSQESPLTIPKSVLFIWGKNDSFMMCEKGPGSSLCSKNAPSASLILDRCIVPWHSPPLQP
jgi:hypothetical protein